MSFAAQSVLDASALLAFLLDEPGAGPVGNALRRRAWISAVNWSEILAKLHGRGVTPESVVATLEQRNILDNLLVVRPLDQALALETARLYPSTRALGLSLADRACLALGRVTGLPVLTADRAWSQLELEVDVRVIR